MSHPRELTVEDVERLSERLMESEANCRALVESIGEAFVLLEPVFDANGRTVDLRYLDVNPAHERRSGRRSEDVVGKLHSELYGMLDEPLLDAFDRVVRSGGRERISGRCAAGNGRYEAQLWRPSPGKIAALVTDVTERKSSGVATARSRDDLDDLIEERTSKLRRSEERFEILSKANALLLSSKEPETVIKAVADMVTSHLGLDVFFNYVYDEGRGKLHLNAYGGITEEVAGEIEWLDLGTAICGCVACDGGQVVSEDVQRNGDGRADLVRSMGVQACACQPLHVGDRNIGTLSFAAKARTHFDRDELDLMLTVADQVSVAIERARAEEALKESEERLRAVVENSLDAVYRRNLRKDHYDYMSPVIEQILGYTAREMNEMCIEAVVDRVHPNDRVSVETELERSKKTGKGQIEYRFRAKNGEYRWLSDRFTVLRNTDGDLLRGGVVRDVTDSKRAEGRLKAVMETMPVGFLIIEENGKVSFMNEEAKRIWAGNIELTSFDDYDAYNGYWPDTGERLRTEEWPGVRAILDGKGSKGVVIDIRRFDGTIGTAIFSSAPVKDDAGNIIGSVLAIQDITEIRQMEVELKHSNAELQQFAYVASHDLQEPLRMVSAYLGLLDKRYGHELCPEARGFMDVAIEGAERMRQLVNDLLQYSRIDTPSKERIPVDMEKAAQRVKDQLHLPIQEIGAEVVIGPLPTVLADEAQMTQLLQNLMTNSIKFRRAVPLRIEITSERKGREWIFAVKDNGIGIEPVYIEKLFKMFQRLHTREEYPGTGIGLAISKKIVEQHGGKIWIESEPGIGSTFLFSLPDAV